VATLVDVDLRSEFDRLLQIKGLNLGWALGGGVRFGAKKIGSNLVSQRAIDLIDAAIGDLTAAFPRPQP
jgi:hypothetical protein